MFQIVLVTLINLWRRMGNAWRRMRFRRPVWVRIDIEGPLPEFAPALSWWQRRFLGARQPLSLQALRRRCQRLRDVPQVRGVLFVFGDLSVGWATIQSLREIISDLRAAGTSVAAYLPGADSRTYMAASAADKVFMPPSADLRLLGVRVEALFLADSLRMAGLAAEVVAVSPYKSGGDQFARASISPEAQEQFEQLAAQRFTILLNTIADARGIPDEDLRRLIDSAPHSAPAAQQAGLIDAVLYEDELEQYLAGDAEKIAIRSWKALVRRLPLPMVRRDKKHVGVVSITGAITQGPDRRSPLPVPLIGGELSGSDRVIQALRQAERDERMAALVLHVDSPGGDAFASDLIWREVERLARKRPVVVSMGDVAASGGYYVAAPAHAIVAQPATITGSIGVYALRPNVAGLLERASVGVAVIAHGTNSGIFSPIAPLSENERAALERSVAENYDRFRSCVRSGRELSPAQLEPIAGGRVWTGEQAVSIGLVDALGGLPAAVARARELAALPADPDAPLMLYSGLGLRDQLPPPPYNPRSC
ncbi:MAG: signal peptide peptidase SppA [Oscillochloris sp.]|nr:signal peptide peptidase SppA [Oscillochloris sp.]